MSSFSSPSRSSRRAFSAARRDAAGAQVLDRARELLGARRVLDPRELERLALDARPSRGARAISPWRRSNPASFASALAISACARRDRLPPLGDARVGRAVRARELGELRLLLRRCARPARPPRSASAATSRGHDVALGREPRGLLGHLVLLALGLLLALRERRHAVLRALDRRLLRAHRVLRGEARVVSPHRASRSAACTSRRDASSSASRAASSRARLRRSSSREPLDLAALELHPADELEVPVRRLVELQVLELAPVGDVALGLGGLALERREVAVDLGDDVADAQQVLLRELHLLLGLLLPALELGDARPPPR